MKRLIAVLIILIAPQAFAQTGTIRGRAIDASTQKSVEFASVTLLLATDSTIVKGEMTDSLGSFELQNLKEGKYILAISSIEYQKIYRGPLVIDPNQTNLDLGNISLITDSKALQEVTVTGSKALFEKKLGGIVMNLDNKLFKTSTNALDVLRKAPSIQVKNDGSILMRNAISPKILIDGKVVPMSDEELKNYLNNLRPDEIESIEIITNPSSRFDSEYKGVIDIRLKRDKNLGWKGTVSSNLRQHKYFGIQNNLNLSYKTKKMAYFTRLGLSDNKNLYILHTDQVFQNGNKLIADNQDINKSKSYSYQAGADYTINSKQTVGVLLKGYNRNENNLTETNTEQFTPNEMSLVQRLYSTIKSLPKSNNFSANLNYEYKAKNSQLIIATALADYKNTDNQNILNQDIDLNQAFSGLRNKLNNHIQIKSAQADFNTNFQKGKIELGTKIAITSTNNKLLYDTLAPKTNLWSFDPKRSNEFVYDESVYAAYLNYSRQVEKLSYEIGLRYEHVSTKANSITLNQITNYDYTKLLPSASLSYSINDYRALSVSYSRRLRRPSFYELNPFQFYISPYTYAVGNPLLRPATTNSFNLSYNYKDLAWSLLYGVNKDEVNQLPFYNSTTNQTAYLRANSGKTTYTGTEVSYSSTITKWWKMNHNFGLYFNISEQTYLDKKFTANITSYYLNGSHVFSLPKSYTLEVSYTYNSANGDALYRISPTYSFDLAIQKSYFKNRLETKFLFNDWFYTDVPRAHFKESSIITLDSYQKYATRKAVLQLVYKFGSSTYKTRQRSSSSAEEENRASK